MNQDKTSPDVKTEAAKTVAKPTPSAARKAPQNGAAKTQQPAKVEVELEMLSYSLARDLARIPREEWFRIESVPCRVGFTRDMAEGIRFIDAVANVVNQKGGLFDTRNLNKRQDLEKCSQEIVAAFRAVILTAVQVARKLNLTNILERHWRLLSVYGPTPKKAERPNTAANSETVKQETAAAEVA